VNDETLVFITQATFSPEGWKQAFPSAHIMRDRTSASAAPTLLWIHLPAKTDIDGYLRALAERYDCRRFVVLSNEPNDDEGLQAFSAGASGYCNAYADPEVLRHVADVVQQGGLWVGRSILDRLVFAVNRKTPESSRSDEILDQAGLTEREREVTRRVADGVANKEVALDLDISERTVKAHLTSAFRKLGVRDRLQLALLLNRGK